MKKSGSIIHILAECATCGWHYGNYKNGIGVAARHAQLYGHKVNVEVGNFLIFDGTQ